MKSPDHPKFEAHLNRKVMGNWLAAIFVAFLLEVILVVSGRASWVDQIMLIALGLLAVVLAIHVFDRRPVLIVGPDTVHDRRLSRHPISWSDLEWHQLKPHGRVPVLALLPRSSATAKIGLYPWSLIYRNQPGPGTKQKGYRIWPLRTHGDYQEFVKAVRAFEPSHT